MPWFALDLSEHDRNVYEDFTFRNLKLHSACHLFAKSHKVRLHEQRHTPALTDWFNMSSAANECQTLIENATEVESLAQHFRPRAVRRSRWRQSKILSLTLLLSVSIPIGCFYKYMLPFCFPTRADNETTGKFTLPGIRTCSLVLLFCVPPLLLFATRSARSEVERVPTNTAKLLGLLRSLHKLLKQSSLQSVSNSVLDNIEILLDNLANCGPSDPGSKLW